MPKIGASATASEMFSNLKSRLGFSQDQGERSGAGDDFGEYDDFDDDGFSEQYDSEFAGYGADYDENAPVGAFRPATTRSGRFGRADSTPNLVSIDDVKANTPLPDKTSSSRRPGSRSLIDDRTPAQSSPAYNASLRDRERETGSNARSEGLNSLFLTITTMITRFIRCCFSRFCLNISLTACYSLLYLFDISSNSSNSSHLESTSFWNSSIIHSLPGLNKCLNRF